ncbi:MAG TPA: hypothetical protein VFB23_06495 [Candidatus Acidoferrales bacterium]|nr:hypothetical protein [Candidatus Acidoferrales bacterium]
MRFPTAQPLVNKINGDAELAANSLGKLPGFRGHFSRAPTELQRPSDHDSANSLVPAKVSQARKLAPGI